MQVRSGSFIEWLVPLAFIFCVGWVVWHMPAFTLDFYPPSDPSEFDKLSALFNRNDVTPNMDGLLGGFADVFDWLALILLPLFAYAGVRTVQRAGMEFESWRAVDKLAVFIGRVTMMLIVLLTGVMLYEVVLRYVFEAPTLWANEMSLWLAGFVFLCAGLYAMQQRSHIRIVLLYDAVPRWVQRIFDSISTILIVAFAFFLIYGGYGEAFDKFYRWETFGTAFDPPIPATLKPMVLLVVLLVATQAVVNLFSDWNKEELNYSSDDLDEEEIERIRAQVGTDGGAAGYVTDQPNLAKD
ncbi:MAG: TRAP transporter small permease [Tateyamaria sp.]|jgi:TRAP-type mannitol/chloroaromatic compound transport system permease small subunit|nr:TRAP transporter small permease [Tateyamaria sp.]MBT6343798.1 TRAP transporter small permease [Tateyamaria sp.]MBT7800418.1 TRAP transporter small permease [Tateyamaria sp.]MDA9224159.1 TRAP transporter small permease [Tateyamaria sp.]